MNVNKININQSEQTHYIASDIYDVSYHNSGTSFESLSALLSSENLSTLIPFAIRCGGMTIRFIQNSNNRYVQYRLMSNVWSTTVADWQGVDDEPTAGSDNLVKSGGVFSSISDFATQQNFSKLSNLIGYYKDELEEITSYSTTDGYYINPNGIKIQIDSYIYSSPIAVQANTLYILECIGYQKNVAVISECDSDGDNIRPVCISSNKATPYLQNRSKNYYYIPKENGYIIICFNKAKEHHLFSVLPSAIYGLIYNVQKSITNNISNIETLAAANYEVIKYSQSIKISNSDYKRTYFICPQGGYYSGSPSVGDTFKGTITAFNDKNARHYISCCNLTLNEGDKITFKVKPNVYGDANSFIFTDADNKVVTVINNGDITENYEFVASCDGIAYINYPTIPKTNSDEVLFTIEYKTAINILSLYGLLNKINENKKELDNKIALIDPTEFEKININLEQIDVEIDKDGYFIAANTEGNKCTILTHNIYAITKPISIKKGEVIVFKGSSFSTNVTIFAETDDNGETYYSLLQCNLKNNTNENTFVYYVAAKDTNVAVCIQKGNYSIYKGLATDYFIRDAYRVNTQLLKLSNKITNNENRINELFNKDNIARYIDLFNKVLFIGDSVTDAHVIDKPNGVSSVVRAISYPTRLNQLVPHLEIINNAHSGESVQGWNKNRFDSEFEAIKDGVDLTVIELGWNQRDTYSWPSDMETFNTVFQSDVKNYGDDFNSYNIIDSVVGNYCQLIKKIQNSTPNMTIILVASFGWSQLRSDFVKAIADWAGVCFIDGHTNIPDGGDGVHFTPFGYLNKAYLMLNYINRALLEKKEYVKMNIYKNNNLV